MTKRVVDCGNCSPDHAAIRRMVQANFDVEVEQTHGAEDTLSQLRSGDVHLLLVNRKLDQDYSDGVDIIRQVKADPQLSGIPTMLVTNYEEHQEAAIALGAVRGFGKLSLADPGTIEKLKPYLA